MGLEAWSRGAGTVCWVERDTRTLDVLRHNVATLCGAETGGNEEAGWRIVRHDAFRYLAAEAPARPFDIVFADPPYDRDGTEHWGRRLLEALAAAAWLAPEGLFVLEQASDEAEATHARWVRREPRVYGGSRLTMYAMMKEGGTHETLSHIPGNV